MAARKLKVAPPAELNVPVPINWSICCLCQASGGILICPAKNPVKAKRYEGYSSVVDKLEELKPFNCRLFDNVNVQLLDEGSGILETLKDNEAKWHKKCVLEFQRTFSVVLAELKAAEEKIGERETLQSEEAGTSQSCAPRSRVTRSAAPMVSLKDQICFLCGQSGSEERPLHRCETKTLCERVVACAKKLEDEKLSAILAEGDLIALEGKYHLRCLVRLYDRAEIINSDKGLATVMCESVAFADLVSYIRMKLAHSRDYVFRMPDLAMMFTERLAQLIGLPPGSLPLSHSSRLREKLLAHIPDLQVELSGRTFILRHDTARVVQTERGDQDEDTLAFYRFAKGLRKCISDASISFHGSFPENCEEKCIPPVLLATVSLLLYGSAVRNDCKATQPALTISQLILSNYRESMPQGCTVRNKRDKEPPLPLYMGLDAYGRGRDKNLIDEMHRRGLSVSSNRIMELTSQLARMVVTRFAEETVLCPPNLRKGLFTVGAFDNIDIKSRSTTSSGEFHGTGISIFQLSLEGEKSEPRLFETTFDSVENRGVRSVPALPETYALLPEVVLQSEKPAIPSLISSNITAEKMLAAGNVYRELSGSILIILKSFRTVIVNFSADSSDLWHAERDWLEHVYEVTANGGEISLPNISWSSFRAHRSEGCKFNAALNSLLPLFDEKSTSPSMVKHAMHIVAGLVKFLNGNQTPVIAADQPLFALIKQIQRSYPEEYGEDKYVAFFGPLHIEMCFLAVLGQLLMGSGWVGVVEGSGILTQGCAEAILKVNHVTRARLMHQKTAATLYSLLFEAYKQSVGDGELTLDEWIDKASAISPTFKFWIIVLNLEILLLSFVRSLRTGDFELYKKSLRNMIPWFFVYDHINYSRWLPVHYKDLEELHEKAPDVNQEFQTGKFVVALTKKSFSAVGIDHAHEQNNKAIKARGAVIGLTQDASKFNRIMLAGPEISRLLNEFHDEDDSSASSGAHHENYAAFQRQFADHCAALHVSFIEHENPFLLSAGDELKDLLVLDTRVVMGTDAVKTLYSIEERGYVAYKEFVQKRLIEGSVPLSETISKMDVKIFTGKSAKRVVKGKPREKIDLKTYWRLFNAALYRSLNMQVFFTYENQKCPPSLSLNGALTQSNKADLVLKLELLSKRSGQPLQCDGLIFDGAFLANTLQPRRGTRNFMEYSESQVLHYARFLADAVKARRVDFAWDLYNEQSVKQCTRKARGEGVRRKELPRKGPMPRDWSDYLRNSQNKEDLFLFLAEEALRNMKEFHVVTNVSNKISSNGVGETALEGIECQSMEEADGRLFLHTMDMVSHGAKTILIRASDTDVVVLAVSFFPKFSSHGLVELWVLYGSVNKRYLAIHEISRSLGVNKSIALRGFHAFTGCDTVSFFTGKGKKTAWNAWMSADDSVTEAFCELGKTSPVLSEEVMRNLEAFTVILYRGRRSHESVNELRQTMFVGENKPLYLIPPTEAALHQHALRAAYQAGVVWGRALKACDIPTPESWGWKLENKVWSPVWSTQEDIWTACRELTVCGCKVQSCNTNRCTCHKAKFPCLPACKGCKGECENGRSRQDAPDDNAGELDGQHLDPDEPLALY